VNKKTNDEPQDFDWGESLMNDPGRTLGLLAQSIEKKVKDDLRVEHQQFTAQTNFWRNFYGRHPELAQDHAVVGEVAAANFEELKGLHTDTGIDRLAELAHERLEATARRHGYGARVRREADVMRGSPEHGSPYTEGPSGSLGSIIKRNRDRRRNYHPVERDAD
jgi:hypothetical protein